MQGKPVSRRLLALCLSAAFGLAPVVASAQAPAPKTPSQPTTPSTTAAPPTPAPATGDKPGTPAPVAPATPEAKPVAPSTTPAPDAAAPKSLVPDGAPQTHEVEPNGSPATPGSATMETIQVPARPIVYVAGQSSYEDAFQSIKASLAKVKAAMDKAGLKPVGHPITIFVDTDEKGFKYKAAIPIAAKPDGKTDLGDGVGFGDSPSGSGLKFRHRGPFDEIDSTYDLIVAYLDEKGLQIDPPYIEEYLTDLTTPDDPKLAVDIYTFIKK